MCCGCASSVVFAMQLNGMFVPAKRKVWLERRSKSNTPLPQKERAKLVSEPPEHTGLWLASPGKLHGCTSTGSRMLGLGIWQYNPPDILTVSWCEVHSVPWWTISDFVMVWGFLQDRKGTSWPPSCMTLTTQSKMAGKEVASVKIVSPHYSCKEHYHLILTIQWSTPWFVLLFSVCVGGVCAFLFDVAVEIHTTQ